MDKQGTLSEPGTHGVSVGQPVLRKIAEWLLQTAGADSRTRPVASAIATDSAKDASEFSG